MSKKPSAPKANVFAIAGASMGAGVSAMFGSDGPQFSIVPLDMIKVKDQIRETFEDEENTLAELAASITARGVLQPILLRPIPDGYELVAGERRYRASKLAGLSTIPAFIREMNDEQADDAQLAENIQRKNLTQIEEAKKIQADLDKLGSIDAVLEKHQKGRPWLSKMMALLHLPEQAKRLVTENVSADLEVINNVKTIEKVNPAAAKKLVDDLKKTRGKTNARDQVAAVKEEVKPSNKQKAAQKEAKKSQQKAQGGSVATPKDRSNQEPSAGDTLDTLTADIFAGEKPKPLTELQQNLTVEQFNKLNDAGVYNLEQLVKLSVVQLSSITGQSTAEAMATWEAASAQLGFAPSAVKETSQPSAPASGSNMPQILNRLYIKIFEEGRSPKSALEALEDSGELEVVEAHLATFYEAGKQAKDVGRGVIQGFRKGQFSSDGDTSFALVAFLHGADPSAKFNLLNILASVKE